MDMTIGMRIKECRIKMRMTQEELAIKMCTKKQTISAYENDKIDMKISVLFELAKILGTTVSYLVEGEAMEMNEEVKQIGLLIGRMENAELRKVALEQIELLCRFEKSQMKG